MEPKGALRPRRRHPPFQRMRRGGPLICDYLVGGLMSEAELPSRASLGSILQPRGPSGYSNSGGGAFAFVVRRGPGEVSQRRGKPFGVNMRLSAG